MPETSQPRQAAGGRDIYVNQVPCCRSSLPEKDRSLARLLVDVPALPPHLLVEILDQLMAAGGEQATLALIAARDVVLMRPANRPEALRALLEMAVAVDFDVRSFAILFSRSPPPLLHHAHASNTPYRWTCSLRVAAMNESGRKLA